MAHSRLAGLDQRMLKRLDRLNLAAESVIGVGFSGGKDSLALAIALHRCAAVRDVRPVLMHVDHRLRPSSSADADRASTLATTIGLPFAVARLEPDLRSRCQGEGVEQQARYERYVELAALCLHHGASILTTGHHRSDQAETVLLHLLRGAGIDGAAGMRELGPYPISAPSNAGGLLLWRPFLTEAPGLLAGYVHETGLDPIDDESNLDRTFRRNAIRHEILPLLDHHVPGTAAALARYAELAAGDAVLLHQLASEQFVLAVSPSGDLDTQILGGMPQPLQFRVVRRWLVDSGVPEPTRERVAAVVAFAASGAVETYLEAGGGQWVIRAEDLLRCGEPARLLNQLSREAGLLRLVGTPEAQISEAGRVWSTPDWTIETRSDVTVRRLRPGDTWAWSGQPVRESLREAGVHPLIRFDIACLASDEGVIAIPGLREAAMSREDVAGFRELTIRWHWKEARL
ncbi:MAG: tRNA lysidine(34) synthetase TilS [Thermomicrobiales bacterium]|nr:tRNA lysidine(34) synthetase TilS [Thermomicrobiales bacterium]